MNVEFSSNAKRTFVMTQGGRTTKFDRGKYRTSDRNEVERLLSSSQMKRGDIKMVTPPELVTPFLEGKMPDKLDAKTLSYITDDGILTIANYFQVSGHGNQPAVAKQMIKGNYIDNNVRKIMDSHKREKPEEDLIAEAESLGIIHKNGPWYKFKNPETGQDDTWGKSTVELADNAHRNKNLLKQAISNAEKEEALEA